MEENIHPQSNQVKLPEQAILESLREFLHVDPVKAPKTLKKFIEVAIQQGSKFYFRKFRDRGSRGICRNYICKCYPRNT